MYVQRLGSPDLAQPVVHDWHEPIRGCASERGPHQGQHCALGKQRAHQVGDCAAQCLADREFASSGGRPHEQETAKIRARDQQHDRRCGPQQEQRPPSDSPEARQPVPDGGQRHPEPLDVLSILF